MTRSRRYRPRQPETAKPALKLRISGAPETSPRPPTKVAPKLAAPKSVKATLTQTRERKVPGTTDKARPPPQHHPQKGPRRDAKRENEETSFHAEDNENELVAISLKKVTDCECGSDKLGIRGSPGPGHHPRERHFEVEMHRHGLLDNIVGIQKLNNYFEVELGAKRMDESGYESNSEATTFDKTGNRVGRSEAPQQPFAFPFQKRARSHSPPRNGKQVFGGRNAESPRPVMATGNFVFGRQLHPEQAKKNKQPEAPRGEDNSPSGLDNDWMYQRLENKKVEDEDEIGEEEIPMGPNEELEFIKLLGKLST